MTQFPLILLLGSTGQLGYELVRSLAPLGAVQPIGRNELDISDLSATRATVAALRPSVIINAAAYTAVDKAESESDVARIVNSEAPRVLAEEAAKIGAAFIHYSTDYVFDGKKGAPYTEHDRPVPLNTYGLTKLGGEQHIAAVGGSYIILRTSWIYGARGRNFFRTILRHARNLEEVRVVSDQIGSPTWSRMVASSTALILRDAVRSRRRPSEYLGDFAGVYHLSAGGTATWFEFAEAILSLSADLHTPYAKLVATTSEEYAAVADRPAYSVLSNDNIASRFGIRLPHWLRQLELVIADGVRTESLERRSSPFLDHLRP